MDNRLYDATSPYLKAHAHQPVNWRTWGQDAFAEAQERGVPVLVSIGYSTCHWCHVMARESFNDPGIAQLINDNFVAIKVDREEQPAVDEYYMNALLALRGSGGWPLTAFTDHRGVPFFAGTYFPPRPAPGQPGFPQVLQAVTNTWRDQATTVRALTDRLDAQLRAIAQSATAAMPADAPAQQALTPAQQALTPVTDEEITAWVERISDVFDPTFGGFGPAPKFPPSMVLIALLGRVDAGEGAQTSGDPLTLVRTTFAGIAAGGMRDQLRGGIARYSTDARWHVPHFEKMLVDNALYLQAVTRWYTVEAARHRDSPYSRLAQAEVCATARFLLTDMRVDGGGLATALDADSTLAGSGPAGSGPASSGPAGSGPAGSGLAGSGPAGLDGENTQVEGAFYTFTRSQVEAARSQVEPAAEGAEPFFELVSFPHSGVEEGEPRRALIAPGRVRWSSTHGGADGELEHRELEYREAPERQVEYLRRLQSGREKPNRDDKLITEDACLAATALLRAGAVMDEPTWVAAGAQVVEAVVRDNVTVSELGLTVRRSSTHGRPGPAAAGLADFAALIRACLELYQVRAAYPAAQDPAVENPAVDWPFIDRLVTTMCQEFLTDSSGRPTLRDHAPEPFVSAVGANPADSVQPSGRSAAAEALALYAHLSTNLVDRAHTLVAYLLNLGRPVMQSTPTAAGWQVHVANGVARGLRVGTSGPECARVALTHPAAPTLDPTGSADHAVVCVGTHCLAPVDTPQALERALNELTQRPPAAPNHPAQTR